jgi:hypothetical protein
MDSRSKINHIAHCPHCGNTAPQRIVATYSCTENVNFPIFYVLVACATCQQATLYKDGSPNQPPQEFFGGVWSLKGKELCWPTFGTLHPSVPSTVQSCYEEAAAIKTRAPNAFANQIRRALEALCKDRGANKKSLAQNLQELCDRGELPPPLGMMTDILRILGNIGSHAADESVGREYVDAIDEFFRAVVEYVYVAPHRVREVQAQLDYARRAKSGGK